MPSSFNVFNINVRNSIWKLTNGVLKKRNELYWNKWVENVVNHSEGIHEFCNWTLKRTSWNWFKWQDCFWSDCLCNKHELIVIAQDANQAPKKIKTSLCFGTLSHKPNTSLRGTVPELWRPILPSYQGYAIKFEDFSEIWEMEVFTWVYPLSF